VDDLLKFSHRPELKNPVLVIGWTADAGKLGINITNYLVGELGGDKFCQVDPVEFSPLNGTTIENDLIQFPYSQFYACPGKDVLILQSFAPTNEWYHFLSMVLDVAEMYHVREIFVVGGMISLGAHTNPRSIMGTCNSIEIKRALDPYEVVGDLNYESPAGQKPTLNSFLLWAAQRRGVPAVSLWVPVPFYLVNVGDYLAQKKIVDFLDRRFDLGLNTSGIEQELKRQSIKIADARNKLPEVDETINRLESNLKLSDEENQKLLFAIDDYLKE
jgi:proteasome assembly chaperone (PAC2) family protein